MTGERAFTMEEVVWPSRLTQVARLLGDSNSCDLRPGDPLPLPYCLSYGSGLDRGILGYGSAYSIHEMSSFRVGEPIVTEATLSGRVLSNLRYLGLRGLRITVQRVEGETAAHSHGHWRAIQELPLPSFNIPVLNVHFGHTEPIYFSEDGAATRARIGEFVLLALLLTRRHRRPGSSVLADFITPITCESRCLLIATGDNDSLRVSGERGGEVRVCFPVGNCEFAPKAMA